MATATEPQIIRPQAGPQERFLASSADIAIYGGAAGSGKSWALLLEPLRHIRIPEFGAVIFRRTYPQVTNEGGLWDEAGKLYPLLGGKPKITTLQWDFPSGASISFAHMQHPSSTDNWYGSQIALIQFDELTQFSEQQFFFMLSRNRSMCGVNPYIRATCNPDSESWLARFISWWIDQESGYPIPERSGKVRWLVRYRNVINWFDSKAEAVRFAAEVELPEPETIPKSVTFVPGRLADNRALMQKDPGYRANLLALPMVEQERLLGGNWKIRPMAGLMFPRDKWRFVDEAPTGMRLCRFWDKAGTEGGAGARTAGVLIGESERRYYVVDAVMGRWADLEREKTIRTTAEMDEQRFGRVMVGAELEPGSGGKDSALLTVRNLAGFEPFTERPSGPKAARWRPFACQQQEGNVYIVKGPWDWAGYIQELDALAGDEAQDKKRLKDLADASAGAFKRVNSRIGERRNPVIDLSRLDQIRREEHEQQYKDESPAERFQRERNEWLAEVATRFDDD